MAFAPSTDPPPPALGPILVDGVTVRAANSTHELGRVAWTGGRHRDTTVFRVVGG
jgi:hypothetical protein